MKTSQKSEAARHPLIFPDESGFSLSPIRGTTRCETGKSIVLRKIFSRKSQTGLGLIATTPVKRKSNFHDGFAARNYGTIFGGVNTEGVIFFLTMVTIITVAR